MPVGKKKKRTTKNSPTHSFFCICRKGPGNNLCVYHSDAEGEQFPLMRQDECYFTITFQDTFIFIQRYSSNLMWGKFFFFLILSFLTIEVIQYMAPHSSTLAWKIPWTEEPGRLQSMRWLRVRDTTE